MPLVGVGLWARRIFEVPPRADLRFPRVHRRRCGPESDGASATVNKWIKGPGLNHVHDFRHTTRRTALEYRLPEELALELADGPRSPWAARSMAMGTF